MTEQQPAPWGGADRTRPTAPPGGWGAPAPAPPPGWGPPPQWGPPGWGPPPPQWGPPPRPPRRSRSAAPIVVGLLAVFALVIALGVGGGMAIVHRSKAGGRTFDEAAADSGGRTGSEAEGSSEEAAETLDDDWKLEGAQPESIAAAECAPAGWMDGATDQYRTEYEKRGLQHTEATVIVTTFGSEAQRAAAVELAHTEEYRECVRLDALPLSSGDVVVEELAPDPRTPGVAFETTDEAGDHVWRFVIGVGVQRSTVTFCGCDTGFDVRRDVALDVAAAMAEAQDLPSPG